MQSQGQISVEYMVIIGFVTVITIPLVIIYQSIVQESNEEISSYQIRHIAKKIVDESQTVYYLGEPSQSTIKINMPGNIVLANLSYGYELVFKIKTKTGKSDIVLNSAVNITGSLPTSQGLYTLTIKAKEDHVEVSYK